MSSGLSAGVRAGRVPAALVAVLLVLAGVAAYRALGRRGAAFAPLPPETPAAVSADAGQGFLYGRVVTVDGVAYEGRLRWGGGEEAFWTDAFNGYKPDNPWAALVPRERLTVRRPVEIFGLRIAARTRPIDTTRPFMARFGDLARIEASGREVRVTLKSGTTFVLDRFDASDFDDGVRVWDAERGVVDLDSLRVRSIELLPTPPLAGVPARLHGTVRTRAGEFTGFLAWDRRASVGTDELRGRSAGGEVALRFDAVRSIARGAGAALLVTLRDGREIELSGRRDSGPGSRGIFVDDRRWGRVLVSLERDGRVDLDPPGAAGSGPAYDEFAPGRPLAGSVTTRAGDRLAGRLVFDLDESETTDTLDAPSGDVDYIVPFGRVSAIELPGEGVDGSPLATVTLREGRALRLELAGDLGEGNAGMLVFVDGRGEPDYLSWKDVARVDFDLPPVRGGADRP